VGPGVRSASQEIYCSQVPVVA
ncbi:hypothetical protein THAOC_09921, partial [Thalassiosira oceanica]